ncbi:MAG TPA: 2-oxo acid dehydrogenase subunit E2 [Candidatus Obscuribacterales bacterium]
MYRSTSLSNLNVVPSRQSAARHIVVDLLDWYGRPAKSSHLFCDINVSWAKSVIEKFGRAGRHITMTAILLKAISLAQKSHPASRTIALPFHRTYTLEQTAAGFTVERIIDSMPAVFFGEIEKPHELSLVEITKQLRAHHEDDLEMLPILKRQYRFARMPAIVRHSIMWLGTFVPSFRLRFVRARFGLSSLGSLRAHAAAGPAVSTSVFGVGEIEDRVVIVDGQLAIRPMMTVTLNYDQRAMDGAPAARFLNDVKKLLEHGWEEPV